MKQPYKQQTSYLLTHSTVQSPSRAANWFAASQEIPRISQNWRFITALTSVRHLSLSWASPIQSTCPHPTSWRSILRLSTHLRLGLPSDLFPSGFPTKTLYTALWLYVRRLYLFVKQITTRFGLKRPSSGYHDYNFAQRLSYICLYCIVILRSHIDIHMTLFEQNCNCDNLKMAALGRNM